MVKKGLKKEYFVMTGIKEAIENKNIFTGYEELDVVIKGVIPGELVMIAGRPLVGKTSMSLNIAKYAAGKENSVVFFSLSASKEVVVRHVVESKRSKFQNVTENRFLNIMIDDTPGMSVEEIFAKCCIYKEKYDLKLVVINYLQLITVTYEKPVSRHKEIEYISTLLKSMAKVLQIPIIVITQLKSNICNPYDNDSILSNLHESGATDKDIDVLILLRASENGIVARDNHVTALLRNRDGIWNMIKLTSIIDINAS